MHGLCLIKNPKKSSYDTDNLRPVAISDTYNFIFETIILKEIRKCHKDNQKQFGFKPQSSCEHALFMLIEAIKIHTSRKLKTYVCTIDASKAFDKINRKLLWIKMFEKNITPAVIIALKLYYENSLALVMNNEEISKLFKPGNGCKQGGAISPILFNLYIEDLIPEIEKLSIGIQCGKITIYILCYADGILLIAKSEEEMSKALMIVSNFGLSHEIKYNPNKTGYLIFNGKSKEEKITLHLNKIMINRVYSTKYLGVELMDNMSSVNHLKKRKSSAFASLSKIKSAGLISESTNLLTRIQLYKTYIRPILYYGMNMLNLNQTQMFEFKRTEGNIVKTMVNLHKTAKTTELFAAFNMNTTEETVDLNKFNLFHRLKQNEASKELLNYSIENQINDSFMTRIVESTKRSSNGQTDQQIEIMVNHRSTELKLIMKTRSHSSLVKEIRKIYGSLDERQRTLSLSALTKTF